MHPPPRRVPKTASAAKGGRLGRRRYKLSTLTTICLLLVYLAGSAALVYSVNYNSKRQALVNAERYSTLILDRNVVTHAFFNNVLKTSLYNLLSEHFFEPTWMSSTFAIQSVASDYEFFGEDGLYYKEASINARNPANEADAHEKAFIERLDRDAQLTTFSEIRDYEGHPFFVIMRRGQLLKEECLLCHGDPADAPPAIVSRYGAERGFGREAGSTVSAISIRIPLAMAYQDANSFSLKLSALLLVVLLAIFVVHYSVSRQLLFQPIGLLCRQARLIANDKENLGAKLPLPAGRELAELVDAFNLMSANLRDYQNSLEETIRERTQQLEQANEALRADIEYRKRIEQEIQKLAFYDQLTGLPNRTLFYDRITQRVAQAERDHQQLALMFFDLDDFKAVNDTLGHAAGDEFLQAIAQRLRDGSRQADTVARLGGDEFVWFGEIGEERDAAVIAGKFLESIARPVTLGAHSFSSTVSIGIALYPHSAGDVVGLLKAADAAMYTVKQQKKNAYEFYRDKPAR